MMTPATCHQCGARTQRDSPVSMWIVVVLPAPLCPSSAVTCPLRISRSKESTATLDPDPASLEKTLLKPSVLTATRPLPRSPPLSAPACTAALPAAAPWTAAVLESSRGCCSWLASSKLSCSARPLPPCCALLLSHWRHPLPLAEWGCAPWGLAERQKVGENTNHGGRCCPCAPGSTCNQEQRT